MEELLAYNDISFAVEALAVDTVLPLPDEPLVECWREWVEESRRRGAWQVLAENLPQLAFPVAAGMSTSEPYRAATLRGVPVSEIREATGLEVSDPQALDLELHASPAGRIPLLVCRSREVFAALVRALARRNEPHPVPESMGALMISGFNNWTRLHRLREAWQSQAEEDRLTATWGEEVRRLQREAKDLYQDRMILVTDGPYSAVPAEEVGLPEEEWRRRSLVLRRDHECAHYFTKRLFGSMRANLHDELLADYEGLVGAFGEFRADLFLRFVGLDREGEVREGARATIYRGDPPLSDGAFEVVQRLMRWAAANVESFDQTLPEERSLEDRAHALTAVASLRLEELAAPDGVERLAGSLAEVRERTKK